MELKTDNIIYHVENLEDLFDLTERLDKLGCKWYGGKSLIDKDYLTKLFSAFQQMCLNLKYGVAQYGNRSFYEKTYPNIPIVTYRREQVDVPTYEVKKAIVPQFVADWIEDHKNNFNSWEECAKGEFVFRAVNDLFRFGGGSETWDFEINDKISKWTLKYPFEFIVAVLFGYEVEEVKLYTVELPNPRQKAYCTVLYRNDSKEIVICMRTGECWKYEPNYQLTEEEIKRDFGWSWQFAVEVE